MSSRLDFDERRARALEGVVMYRPGAAAPLQPPAGGETKPSAEVGDAQERRRRRRRRGRRRGHPHQGPEPARREGGAADQGEGRQDAPRETGGTPQAGNTGNGGASSDS